jgi:hypothetical protein
MKRFGVQQILCIFASEFTNVDKRGQKVPSFIDEP